MKKLTRRNFMQTSTALAAGAVIPGESDTAAAQSQDKPSIKRYKPFGKTGWQVGDISAGASLSEPGLISHMFECGINLIDTGYQYTGHGEIIAKILPEWREKVFIVDKWDPYLVTADVTKAALMEQLDVMLKRLNTDYVDCLMIHALGHPDIGDMTRVRNPAIYEAFDEAKKAGKIRFTGASGKTPGTKPLCVRAGHGQRSPGRNTTWSSQTMKYESAPSTTCPVSASRTEQRIRISTFAVAACGLKRPRSQNCTNWP